MYSVTYIEKRVPTSSGDVVMRSKRACIAGEIQHTQHQRSFTRVRITRERNGHADHLDAADGPGDLVQHHHGRVFDLGM